MHPTPHGLRLVTATPLGTPVVAEPTDIGTAAPVLGWRRHLQVRTWVMVALALPLGLGVAASTADAYAESARVEAQDAALAEASRFVETVVVPLRAAAAAPDAERVREMQRRMNGLSDRVAVHETTARLQLASPTGVEIVARAAVGPGAGTAVCLAAVRWPAVQGGKASWKGPFCFVESRGA